MKKLAIFDYDTGEIYMFADNIRFYEENGDFSIDEALLFINNEHDLDFYEGSIHWMMTAGIINIL